MQTEMTPSWALLPQNSICFHGIKWVWLRHGLYLGEMHSSRNIHGIINWAWYAAEESQYAMSANQIHPEILLRLLDDLISEQNTTETSFLLHLFPKLCFMSQKFFFQGMLLIFCL